MMQTRMPTVSLIHIGLPKTATTFMQNRWAMDSQVCLVRNGTMKLIIDARLRAKQGAQTNIRLSPASIHFDNPPESGQKVIFSNEALSSAYVNERATAAEQRAFQELVAQRMKSTVAKSKVLLVTRRPEKIILSLYNQAIKQGGTDTLRQFIQRERDYLEQVLNIRELFNIWKQHYGSGNVMILPMELLRDDEVRFYKAIEKFSGVPSPKDAVPPTRANASLQGGQLELMRQFNKWARLFSAHGRHNGTLPVELEKALATVRYDLRRGLELPTPELNRRLQLLEPRMQQPSVSEDDLPRDLLKSIRAGNAKQLKKDDFFGYRKLYV